MRILFAASEASPIAKVGGLADVVGSLPKALVQMGHDVRVIIPRYGSGKITLNRSVDMVVLGKRESASLETATLTGEIPLYQIANANYFGANAIYGENDLRRFFFFSRAVIELLAEMEWQPEVMHCHDWHTALIVMWLKKQSHPYASLFTIHNLAYQGIFNKAFLVESGLDKEWSDSPQGSQRPPLNFLSQGIIWADLVTTVSRTYAEEILTPEYGEGLNHLLRYRQEDLLGIVNGIDNEEYNPETDPYIAATYNQSTLEGRAANKTALQKQAMLHQDPEIPMIGMVQRLDEQKGLDITEKALSTVLAQTGAQLVILGSGRDYYENRLKQVASRHSDQMALFVAFDNPLAHLIYAACDLFLMPSRFEPCGLGQLIAMRYGALPVVHHTGGLVDTVSELSPDLSQGNGFVFKDYTPAGLTSAIRRGTDAFRNKRAWREAMRRVMRLDFSWQASAIKYEAAYRAAVDAHRSRVALRPG